MASMASFGMAMLPGSTLPLRQVSSAKGLICMAVPKKRTSKMKKRIRHAVWMQKAARSAEKALSLAKSVLTGRSNSFYYETEEPAPPKCTQGDWAVTEEEMRELMKDDKEVAGRPETILVLLQWLSSFVSRMVLSLRRFIT